MLIVIMMNIIGIITIIKLMNIFIIRSPPARMLVTEPSVSIFGQKNRNRRRKKYYTQ